ncbi:hypothetical protein LEP1GSC150_2678 [Leptospira interrogans serovar Copenhageni str. LT2050]|uniref:Uncharacterized protein n=1 Tax=Leptospira interrogans serovar Copenhageni str. LT2050 TaxID=1001598 RepID=M3HBY4_LEPIT|nr:hypothetical protein LEP1GSC150_2678 [Leptospira interrogans serovar Copenhageni str. LT2050]
MQKPDWTMILLYFIVVPTRFNCKFTICESSHIYFFLQKLFS